VKEIVDFELQGAFIPLDALLKTTGLASSGGAAKAMVAASLVQVDGQLELRKRRKIRVGQVVSTKDGVVRVIDQKA
jgi:ribosome-associated protein